MSTMRTLPIVLTASATLLGECFAGIPSEEGGRGRGVFIGVSAEAGGLTMDADGGRFHYNPGLRIGGSIEVGRDPFSIELGRMRTTRMTPIGRIGTIARSPDASIERTGAHGSFIRLKCRIAEIRQVRVWIGAGIDRVDWEHHWESDATDRWHGAVDPHSGIGAHWQVALATRRWTASELSLSFRSWEFGPVGRAVPPRFPLPVVAPDSFSTSSISVRWTHFLYESPP